MAKKTVAYRLPEEVGELMGEVIGIEGTTTSSLVTSAVGQYFSNLASANPDFADALNVVAQRRLEQNIAEICTLFGSQVLDHLQIKLPE